MNRGKIKIVGVLGILVLALFLVCAKAEEVEKGGKKVSLAVYPLDTRQVDRRLSPALTSLVRAEVVKSEKIAVIPEEMFLEVVYKQDIQATDYYEQRDTQVQLGKMLKADKIVVGGVSSVNGNYLITLEVIDVTAGVIDNIVAVSGKEEQNDLSRMASVAGGRLRDLFDPRPQDAPRPIPGHLKLPEAPPLAPAKVVFDNTPKLELKGHKYNVHSLAYSADGKRLFSGATDKTIKVWNTETGEFERNLINHTDTVLSLAVSPDGKFLLSGSRDGTAVLWNLANFTPLEQYKMGGDVYGAAFAPDSQRIVLAGGSEVRLLEKREEAWTKIWAFHLQEVLSLAYSPDGDFIAAGGEYGLIRVIHADTGREIRRIERTEEMREVRCLVFDPWGRYLVSGSDDDLVHVWTPNGIERLRMGGHLGDVNATAMSAQGNVIFSAGNDQKVNAWSADNGKLIATLKTGRGDLLAVALRPGAGEIATGGRDGMVRVYRVTMEE